MALMTTGKTIEIRDITGIVRRRKWLIIIPLIVVSALTLGISFLMPQIYESSTMVVIDEEVLLSRELQELVPGQDMRGAWAAQQREDRLISIRNEIVSTGYLTRLIEDVGLNKDPKIILQAQKLHNQRQDVPVEELINRLLIEKLRREILVSFNGQNIVQISAESPDPNQAMQIASRLAQIFKDEQLNRDLTGVRGTLDFSDEQLAIYRRNLQNAENRLSEFRTEYLQNQLDESVTADANIRSIIADVDNLKQMIDDNLDQRTRLRTSLADYKKADLNLQLGNDYNNLKDEIFSETKRLADFMSKYTWSDPKVLNANVAINRRLREMETKIADAVADQFGDATEANRGLLTQYFVLQLRETIYRQKITDCEVALSTLRSRIARLPEYEIRLSNLENEVTSARQIYETFRSQLTGSEISQSLVRGGAESKYRVMEPAAVPLEPVRPDRIRMTLMGIIFGLIIGGAAVLLVELLDNSFKKVEEVEEILKTPVLATIPTIAAIKGKIKL